MHGSFQITRKVIFPSLAGPRKASKQPLCDLTDLRLTRIHCCQAHVWVSCIILKKRALFFKWINFDAEIATNFLYCTNLASHWRTKKFLSKNVSDETVGFKVPAVINGTLTSPQQSVVWYLYKTRRTRPGTPSLRNCKIQISVIKINLSKKIQIDFIGRLDLHGAYAGNNISFNKIR